MALRETAIHTSPSHHYVCPRSLLPSRLSSFPVDLSLPYAFPVSPSIYLPLLFCWSQTYCGIIDSAGSLLRLLRHSNRVYFIFTFWLHMLMLGFASAKSHLHVQLIRAELSSNGSSEPLSESLSKLSSHQIPRCLRVPLQLEGCTRTSTLFSPTTPSGASVLCAFSSRSALHFDLGVK